MARLGHYSVLDTETYKGRYTAIRCATVRSNAALVRGDGVEQGACKLAARSWRDRRLLLIWKRCIVL